MHIHVTSVHVNTAAMLMALLPMLVPIDYYEVFFIFFSNISCEFDSFRVDSRLFMLRITSFVRLQYFS